VKNGIVQLISIIIDSIKITNFTFVSPLEISFTLSHPIVNYNTKVK